MLVEALCRAVLAETAVMKEKGATVLNRAPENSDQN